MKSMASSTGVFGVLKTVTVHKRIINNIKKQKRKSKRKQFKKEIIEVMINDYRATTTESL